MLRLKLPKFKLAAGFVILATLLLPITVGAETEANTALDSSASAETISVQVKGQDVGGTPVVLRVSRRRGPFEAKWPEPAVEKEALADSKGLATFDVGPQVMSSRRVLYAVVNRDGYTYYSPLQPAQLPVNLTVQLTPVGKKKSDAKVRKLETIVQPWEDYLIFTQVWRLASRDGVAVDTTQIGDTETETGLPIEMPMPSEGITVKGEGEHKVVDSTIYWKGTLQPDRAKKIRVRYSIKASEASFIFDQSLDYPVEAAQVYLPLQTGQEKLPRLNNAELIAPGFEGVRASDDSRIFRGTDVLIAEGATFEAGDTLTFQIRGLPYGKPIGPWVATGLGFAAAFLVLVVGFRDGDESVENQAGGEEAARHLRHVREQLIERLMDIEDAYADGRISEHEFEEEKLRIREQLSVVVEKLENIESG